jgi:hypothetical protein
MKEMFQVQIKENQIVINNKITLGIDCSDSLSFDLLNKGDERCSNIVEIAKILDCYIKYEIVYDAYYKWLMPTHIIFQKNNEELEIQKKIPLFGELAFTYKINTTIEKIYKNVDNVINSKYILLQA